MNSSRARTNIRRSTNYSSSEGSVDGSSQISSTSTSSVGCDAPVSKTLIKKTGGLPDVGVTSHTKSSEAQPSNYPSQELQSGTHTKKQETKSGASLKTSTKLLHQYNNLRTENSERPYTDDDIDEIDRVIEIEDVRKFIKDQNIVSSPQRNRNSIWSANIHQTNSKIQYVNGEIINLVNHRPYSACMRRSVTNVQFCMLCYVMLIVRMLRRWYHFNLYLLYGCCGKERLMIYLIFANQVQYPMMICHHCPHLLLQKTLPSSIITRQAHCR